MDLIGITNFAAGAMENWGLITFRETSLLIPPQSTHRTGTARTISHEIVHQWFGNLVTMPWWNTIWLNEGFARFIEFLAVDHIFPHWQIWTQFVQYVWTRAMDLDALESSHPIEVDVKSPGEINEIFDSITYAKGGAVNRMLAAYLGPKFWVGLNHYLKRHSYNVAGSDDLWKALAEVSGDTDVAKMMHAWTKKVGFPVLEISESASDPTTFILRQQRFKSASAEKSEEAEEKSGESELWVIPVTARYAAANQPLQKMLLATETGEMKMENVPVVDGDAVPFCKFNVNQHGFYRVMYVGDNLRKKLMNALYAQLLPLDDRVGLEDDTYALASAGMIPLTDYFELILDGFANENQLRVISAIGTHIGDLEQLLSAEPYYENFQKLSIELFGPRKLTCAHTAVIRLLAAGDEAELANARKLFADGLNNEMIPVFSRTSIYCAVIRNSTGSTEFDMLFERMERMVDMEEKGRCLAGLAWTKDPLLLKRVLEKCLTETQEVSTIFLNSARNPLGRDLLWKFLTDNWGFFVTKFGGALFVLPKLVTCATTAFTTVEKADEIEQFFAKHGTSAIARSVRQSVERIRTKAKILSRERDAVAKWLDARFPAENK
eukprot:TRINITY_DN20009_c0_g1_i1.p1 TRINITY_DN20009_c0_g1~~TRINITY_DN20009_c0_g1_i1.p1  ORF type:complete len:615 (-),score=110.66 TRINITY_DN20009_c0_g1_i1:64-1881(-)